MCKPAKQVFIRQFLVNTSIKIHLKNLRKRFLDVMRTQAQDFSLEMQEVQCGSALLPLLKVEEATGFKGEDSRITINTFGRRGM